ncbi:hypothetical protein [Aestuariivirga sp.]|uniref:hypothetical protein n=1 Tax=Aestuariivirga sp. TaxID=2650926 RepID=UPI003BADB9A1
MLVRRIVLSAAALLLAGLAGSEAMADRRRPPPPPPYYEDEYYPGPPLIRRIPGLRILFGDYAMSQEEFDALYGPPRKHRRFDDRYYEPEIPPPPPRSNAKPKTTAAKTAKPATGTAAAKQAPQKTTAANQKLASSTGTLSCEKATSVVSGYGFSSVEAASCSGKVYAFKAQRGGNSFAIKLDSGSGELTEVKKLP